jgi:hypothetical protein
MKKVSIADEERREIEQKLFEVFNKLSTYSLSEDGVMLFVLKTLIEWVEA